MSEIKGQLLGIILVIMIFASVGGLLYGAFRTMGEGVSNQVSAAITEIEKN